jgi:NADPH2:quinone reductase
MRVLHIEALTGPDGIRLVEAAEPVAPSATVVEVHAVGVRYPDLLRSRGLYQERSEVPYVPFSELAGVVLQALPGSPFNEGDRVFGTVAAAGSEIVVAQDQDLFRLPADITFEQGAGIALNYQTAIFGLEKRARLVAGETVLVHGAGGGLGGAAIQVAKAMGATVIGVTSSDAKAHAARSAGADHVIAADNWKDAALDLTDGIGVDVVWDPVGGDRVLDNIRCAAIFGRWLVIGFVGGPIPEVPLNRILLRNIDVMGVSYSGYVGADPNAKAWLQGRLEALLAADAIRPDQQSIFDFADAASALRALDERRAIGKVVLRVK